MKTKLTAMMRAAKAGCMSFERPGAGSERSFQIAYGGTGAVSVNAIARKFGVSGPALYRYFASRDDLLAELVVDAYHDLADALFRREVETLLRDLGATGDPSS